MTPQEKIFIASLTDHQVVEAILQRDETVTRLFFFEMCYPLFNALYVRYKDALEWTEPWDFISEFYVYLMEPGKLSKRSKLSTFSFRCRLVSWLKRVATNYCASQAEKSKNKLNVDSLDDVGDRIVIQPVSINIDSVNREDIEAILSRMSNARYRNIIRFVYIDGLSYEATAQLLDMTMNNFYNKIKLAKEQFVSVLKKERLV